MAKYIDAEKLIHDLEERIFAYSEGYAEGDDNRKDAIETLLKDVKYQYSFQQEQPEVDLEKIIEHTYHDGSVADTDDIDHVTYENIARHFYELGKKDMKEQMMKEAVEADVKLTLHDKTGDVSLHTGYLPKELGIKWDDMVRIIIVKEEENK